MTADRNGRPASGAVSRGRRLDPGPLAGSGDGRADLERLSGLSGSSVTHPAQLDRETVVALCRTGARLETTDVGDRRPLGGTIAITAFFEASTRTRLSFESAVLRLHGTVLSVPDARVTGAAKGESLADMGEMFNSYGDIVVMRHPETSSVEEIADHLVVPLVNAGNGSGHHPTQALVDWFALLKWRPSLAGPECPPEEAIHLGIVGTPGSMRAVKSFVWLSTHFPGAVREITIVSETADPLGAELEGAVAGSAIPVASTTDLVEVLGDLDVIYMNSITLLGDRYERLNARYRIDAATPLRPGAVVMHPLARGDELDPALDATEHNLYFAQAAGAVFVRQALLAGLLGRAGTLADALV